MIKTKPKLFINQPSVTKTGEEESEIEKWAERHLVEILYSSAHQVLLGSILTLLIVASILSTKYSLIGISLLFSVGIGVAICRYTLSYTFELAPEKYSSRTWLNLWRATTFVSGLVYAGYVFFYLDSDPTFQILIICAVVGTMAATTSAYASDLLTCRLFMYPPATIMLAHFISAEGSSYLAMSSLFTFFLVIFLHSSWQINRVIVENIKLTYSLQYRATHDSLVGMLNRDEFEKIFKQRQALGRQSHALVFIDLDNFKSLNDTLGHQKGDEMLKQVGQIIKRSVRKEDAAARLGGDEFVVLLSPCTKSDSLRVANHILDSLQKSQLSLAEGVPRVGASIGISYSESGLEHFEELMRAADQACYEAKRTGKGRICVRDAGVAVESSNVLTSIRS